MKKLLAFASVALLFASCSLEKPNVEKAKEVAEACLQAVDKGDIKTVREEYYTSEFVQAESEAELTEKFKKLRDLTGPITSFEVKESALETEQGEEACVKLTYAVKHERVTTREEFLVVIEGGKHKIGSHIISNE
jgi:hypothetical protein